MPELLNETIPIMSFFLDFTKSVISLAAAADFISPTLDWSLPAKGSSILALRSNTKPI